jgi:hypothetical protein
LSTRSSPYPTGCRRPPSLCPGPVSAEPRYATLTRHGLGGMLEMHQARCSPIAASWGILARTGGGYGQLWPVLIAVVVDAPEPPKFVTKDGREFEKLAQPEKFDA